MTVKFNRRYYIVTVIQTCRSNSRVGLFYGVKTINNKNVFNLEKRRQIINLAIEQGILSTINQGAAV